MNIERALKITGWMSEKELNWLARQATSSRIILEIGSWRGRSTRALGDHVRGMVFAVDHWLGDDDETKSLEDEHIKWGTPLTTRQDYEQIGGDEVFRIFLENVFDLIEDHRILPVRASSEEAEILLGHLKGNVDFIFIDGSHTESACGADIDRFRPFLRSGGILSGHDYDNLAWHAGVKKAVGDRFGRIHTVDTIWWTKV